MPSTTKNQYELSSCVVGTLRIKLAALTNQMCFRPHLTDESSDGRGLRPPVRFRRHRFPSTVEGRGDPLGNLGPVDTMRRAACSFFCSTGLFLSLVQ